MTPHHLGYINPEPPANVDFLRLEASLKRAEEMSRRAEISRPDSQLVNFASKWSNYHTSQNSELISRNGDPELVTPQPDLNSKESAERVVKNESDLFGSTLKIVESVN